MFKGVIQHDGVYEYAVDPGETNIIQAHVYRDGQLVAKFSLTRGQYYAKSMLDYSTKCWKKWNKRPILKNLIEGGSTHHFKKANINDIATSFQYYQSVRADIRAHKLIPNKFERLKFYTYGKKKQTIHKLLSKMVKISGEKRPIMFYGNGGFASSRKGTRSVPCKWVKQECKIFFKCYSVDEFRTSQICPICDNRLWDVRKRLRSKLHGKTFKIRGLKFCNSDGCRSHRYMNRDDVGCTNIYRKTRTTYPEIMSRSQPGWDNNPQIHEYSYI